MMNVQFHPEQIDASVFIGRGAVIVGNVTLAAECSVWFNATIRGDIDIVRIGSGSNVQEGAVLHVDPGFPLTIGRGVTIGHGAIVHGCTVGDNVVVGMGSILLNGCQIGNDSIVGAGALVTQGKVFPPRSLILGSPAKAVRELTEAEVESNRGNAARYVERAAAFKEEYGSALAAGDAQ